MIIARSPLRISLGGGGTDLPSYYREYGGFLLAAAIDKAVYVTVHRTFLSELVVRYSKIERVGHPREVHHPIVREALALLGVTENNVEITSMADIPAGTGLGSSGSFGTALLKALHRFRNKVVTPQELAEKACHIEIDVLGEPVGKQDQYVAAFGGVNAYEFRPDGSVAVSPLEIAEDTLREFEVRVLLFSTGIIRQAPEILKDQDDRTKQRSAEMIQNLHHIKEIGYESKAVLEAGKLDAYGALLHEHWEHKRQRSKSISSPRIDHWYGAARANGALGGKLIGAGGGGFLMFLADDPTRLRKAMEAEGLAELRFGFDYEGTRILS
ncbi:MAG TPA: galactokinase [Gemmataceae bacterium]|nr:galactokinase [Gemmataceae bacterium]